MSGTGYRFLEESNLSQSSDQRGRELGKGLVESSAGNTSSPTVGGTPLLVFCRESRLYLVRHGEAMGAGAYLDSSSSRNRNDPIMGTPLHSAKSA